MMSKIDQIERKSCAKWCEKWSNRTKWCAKNVNRTKLCAKNVKSADKFEQNGAQKCQIERKIKQNAVPKMSNRTKLCAKNVKSADKF